MSIKHVGCYLVKAFIDIYIHTKKWDKTMTSGSNDLRTHFILPLDSRLILCSVAKMKQTNIYLLSEEL